MKYINHLLFVLILNTVISSFVLAANSSAVIEESDFHKLSQKMQKTNKGLLLMIHSEACHYCAVLDEQVLSPMIHSGEYKKRLFIRKLQVDKSERVNNFIGKMESAFEMASDYDAHFTPTLLFLDNKGTEKGTKIIGLSSIDFIGATIDEQIEVLMKTMQKK